MQNWFAAAHASLLLLLFLSISSAAQNNTLRQGPDPRSPALNIEKVNKRPASATEQSIKDYETLLRAEPTDAVLMNNLGAMYFLSDRIFEAQSMLRKAAQRDPESVQIQVNLAIALNRAYNPGLAIATLENVLKKSPADARARQVLCEFYTEVERFRDAITCYDVLESSGKLGSVSASSFGTILMEDGQVDRALRLLTWADSKFPDDPGIKNGLGVALFRKKEYSLAEASLRRAVELGPRIPQVRYNLAITQIATNKRGAVLEQYKYLKTADPDLAGKLFKILFRDKVISVKGQ